ncbi:MAG TPA: hypothetical protein DCR14_17120 [Acidimicrobiaceae bacterium]|mgnify:CR=1 FL=1|nr:hypothetical protein [Acidimicrobiaceae bacterium]
MRRRLALLAAFSVVVLGACSDDGSSATTEQPDVTICTPSGTAQPDTDLPQVGRIAEAVDALEGALGAPPEFFEVNATARAVNLFVALSGGTIAQQWIYVDGGLTSTEGQAAQGGTFTADQLAFDPTTVLATVRDEVPDLVLQTFYVNGDGQGSVRYAVLGVAQCGGGLDIVVDGDGGIVSVDPL